MDNPMIDTLCQFQPPWAEQLAMWKALTTVSGDEASKYVHIKAYTCKSIS